MSERTDGPRATELLHLPIRPEWLAGATPEPILHPDIPIVDAHHHLWDRESGRYLHEEFEADLASGHHVVATVFVEARSFYRTGGPAELRPVGETELVASAAGGRAGCRTTIAAAIVAYADLTLGARVGAVLREHVRAGDGRLRGVRHSCASSPEIPVPGRPPLGLLLDRRFREGVAELEALGLSFDAWIYHTQLRELADLAGAFPRLKIALNHLGGLLGVGRFALQSGEAFARWADDLSALAEHPNVYVKIGGFAMPILGHGFHERLRPPSSMQVAEAVHPHVEVAVAAFGVHRAMFGSNFPVDKGAYSYATFWNAAMHLTAGMSVEERRSLLAGSASDFYELDLSSMNDHDDDVAPTSRKGM